MIIGGEVSGKNFLTPFAFQYAKQRVANKQKNETIEEYPNRMSKRTQKTIP